MHYNLSLITYSRYDPINYSLQELLILEHFLQGSMFSQGKPGLPHMDLFFQFQLRNTYSKSKQLVFLNVLRYEISNVLHIYTVACRGHNKEPDHLNWTSTMHITFIKIYLWSHDFALVDSFGWFHPLDFKLHDQVNSLLWSWLYFLCLKQCPEHKF